MLILLSPSKTMDYNGLKPITATSKIIGSTKSESLRELLLSLSDKALKDIYKASDLVVQKAKEANLESRYYVGIELFNGLVYKQLDYQSLNTKTQDWLNTHVFILSAMYGIIPADAGISPYRLDLNNNLSHYNISLQKMWFEEVNHLIASMNQSLIIDLSSREYRKLIDIKRFKDTYVLIDFKDFKKGKPVTLGTYSKMARGLFLREMAHTKPLNKTALQKLKVMGYTYNPEYSKDDHYVYTR